MSRDLFMWSSLTKIFLKVTTGNLFSMKVAGTESKWAGIAVLLLVGVAFLPILWIVYNVMSVLFEAFYAMGNLHLGIAMGISMGSLLVFVFSLMAAPALFYFSKDVEYLLPLPIKPTIIIGSKFTMALLYEYLITVAIMIPITWALFPYVSTVGLIINAILTTITIPVVPLVYSTILTMFLVRVSRFGRNPDRYALFIGLVGIVISVVFYVGLNHMMLNIDPEQISEMMMGNPVVINSINWIFPNNTFAARGIADNNLIFQAINYGVTIVAVIIFFILAKMLYFKGVIGLSESGSNVKKMTADDVTRSAQGQSQFKSYLMKELRLLFRSPSALLNCVLGAFVMPIMIIAMLFIQGIGTEFDNIFAELSALINFNDSRTLAISFVAMSAIGLLSASMVTVTSTAISREGQNFFIMKYIPVPYRTQLNAKAFSGIIISLLVLLFYIAAVVIILNPPIHLILIGTLLAMPNLIALNYLGLLIDLTKPKLVWDNEQVAVKQNYNSLIPLFGGWALVIGMGALGWFFMSNPVITFIAVFAITTAIAIALYSFTLSRGKKLLSQLS